MPAFAGVTEEKFSAQRGFPHTLFRGHDEKVLGQRGIVQREGGTKMFKKGPMRSVNLGLAVMTAAASLAATAPLSLAQTNQTTNGPSAEEEGTQAPIQATPIPGTSTTGNASGPAGTTSRSQATGPQSQTGSNGQDSTEGSGNSTATAKSQ